jgi:hypothetical protein
LAPPFVAQRQSKRDRHAAPLTRKSYGRFHGIDEWRWPDNVGRTLNLQYSKIVRSLDVVLVLVGDMAHSQRHHTRSWCDFVY